VGVEMQRSKVTRADYEKVLRMIRGYVDQHTELCDKVACIECKDIEHARSGKRTQGEKELDTLLLDYEKTLK
jgi:hypothetical protein